MARFLYLPPAILDSNSSDFVPCTLPPLDSLTHILFGPFYVGSTATLELSNNPTYENTTPSKLLESFLCLSENALQLASFADL